MAPVVSREDVVAALLPPRAQAAAVSVGSLRLPDGGTGRLGDCTSAAAGIGQIARSTQARCSAALNCTQAARASATKTSNIATVTATIADRTATAVRTGISGGTLPWWF